MTRVGLLDGVDWQGKVFKGGDWTQGREEVLRALQVNAPITFGAASAGAGAMNDRVKLRRDFFHRFALGEVDRPDCVRLAAQQGGGCSRVRPAFHFPACGLK